MIKRFLASIMLISLCSCGPSSEEQADAGKQNNGGIPAELTDSDGLSGENALYHAAKIVSFGERAPQSPGYRQQLNYLKSCLNRNGWECVEQSFRDETVAGNIHFTNLRARFGEGGDFKQSAKLLLTCHIDTKTGIENFVGANDGASAAGLIVELSRILRARPELASQIELVFFDGEESFAARMTEEDGLYGSKYYVSKLKPPLPSWLINLDMVGRQGMKIKIPPSTPQTLYNIYNEAVSHLKLSRASWGVAAGEIYDDHIPFVQKGIPSINIIDDFNDGNWWHTSKDNLDILSARSFKDSGELVLYMIQALLQ